MLFRSKKFLRIPASETSGVVELRAEEMGEVSGGSSLRYIQYSSSCVVVAIGQVHFVSEVAEQLGWLGSALRSSPISEGIVACSPRLSRLQILTEDTENDGAITASCRIEFPLRVDASMNPQSQGFCWANLFRNPVLVTGYPIPRRAESKTGLEISLAMMAELVQSQSLVKIAERTILKGFCSLAVVTGVVRDAIIWHFLFNSSGERISYSDHRLEDIDYGKAQALTLRGVGSGRHIIGWCGDIKDYLGHPKANPMITSSGLPPAPSSIVIDRLYLEGGSQVIGGVSVSIGKKDKPIYLQRMKSYSGLLDWVSLQPIMFYDVGDRRAWLGDGASALLHLVRASIDRDRDEPAYRSKWRFDGKLEGDASGGNDTTMSAIDILGNFNNLNRELYLDDVRPNESGHLVEAYYRFRDRVQEILYDIQILVDYQGQVAAQDGYWIRRSGKFLLRSVMGFDFWDVAKPGGPIQQRAHSLQTGGHGWVDYIRSIKATTIFGQNFGELLQADNPTLLCPSWKTVPTGMDYMGSSIVTLKRLQRAKDRSHLGPGEITSEIIWSSRCELFSQCKCVSLQVEDTALHLDPVQLLLPRRQNLLLDVPKTRVSINLERLKDNGAVIFGHTPYIVGPGKKKDEQYLTPRESQTSSAPSMGSEDSQSRRGMSTASSSMPPTLSPSATSATHNTQLESNTDTSSWETTKGKGKERSKKAGLWSKIFSTK